jgi:predicted MPP superfamily phosphohydrolase
VDNWIRVLPELNVQPLINERDCPLSYDDKCALYVAGLEDIETRRIRYGHHSMDIHRALTGRVKATPTIVLAHQPRAAAEAIQWDDVRLVLSGHTHGGQILFMMLPVYLYNPFFAGLYQPLPDVSVYVSAGTNYYLLPYRHYRPEITHITLLSK